MRILKDSLGEEQQTLAETLRDNGYSTAAFVHNGWVMRGGAEQGFDHPGPSLKSSGGVPPD